MPLPLTENTLHRVSGTRNVSKNNGDKDVGATLRLRPIPKSADGANASCDPGREAHNGMEALL